MDRFPLERGARNMLKHSSGSMWTGIGEFHPETVRYIMSANTDKRASLGQFFTPRRLREELLSKLPRLVKPRVLDPACGTGEFLLSAKDYFVEPELYCWEVDPEVADIAKKLVPEAKVEIKDSLLAPFEEKFDVVIGNPPYFEFKPPREIRDKYREIVGGRVNIYSLFIYLGIKLLKPGGYLAYVVSSSMNNGAYFRKLREIIVENTDIVYLKRIDDAYVFSDPAYRVNHTFQLLVLRKDRNTGRYVFKHGNHLVFSENYEFLRKVFESSTTLRELGYRVQTGKIVWNQNRDKLTNDPKKGILLIWSHNIKKGELVLNNNPSKPQYIMYPADKADKGPAIVATRIVGHPSRAQLEAALIPPGTVFVAENHVNVIYPSPRATIEELQEIVRQLNSDKTQRVIRELIGNTQVSKTELENLIPLEVKGVNKSSTLLRFLQQTH